MYSLVTLQVLIQLSQVVHYSLSIYCPGHACRSTVLGTPESVGMNGQIDWQAQQISHLVCSLAGQRCSEAWGTFSARTSQSITALTAWRKEERRKEAADNPPSKAENDLCSTRQILALFRGQPWGDCWETGRSAYGPFRVLRCHLELKLKLKLIVAPSVDHHHHHSHYITMTICS